MIEYQWFQSILGALTPAPVLSESYPHQTMRVMYTTGRRLVDATTVDGDDQISAPKTTTVFYLFLYHRILLLLY